MASIRKRGNAYRIHVSDGYYPDGRKRVRTATFQPDPTKTDRQNQKALEYFAADFERSVLAGSNFDGEKMTFAELVKEYERKYGERRLQEKTLESYMDLLRVHVLPEIGSQRVARIKTGHLNNLYDKLYHERKDGIQGGYGASTIKRVHGVVSSVFRFAVKSGIIESSPCDNAILPREEIESPSEEIKSFTVEQTGKFLDYITQPYAVTRHPRNRKEYTQICSVPEQMQIFLKMALLCGCRRSELIALEWSDIDFDKKELSITKATVIVKGALITKTTKTKGSNRKISLPSILISDLRQYRQHQREYRLKIGSQWLGDNYIFIQWDGTQMRPETPYKAFKRLLERYNETYPNNTLPNITLHDLRHTNATLLISENTDIRTVSQRLGHSRTSTTLDIYSHALESKDRAAADTIAGLFYPKENA